MSTTTMAKDARIDARIPSSVKRMLEEAARLQGRSMTDFFLSAVIEKAESVIAQHRLIALGRQEELDSALSALASEEREDAEGYIRSISAKIRPRQTEA